uniref:Uncharacterized protein n=1 Tax=Arundo donax TaxID=35708 RepID=A0A0A8XRZ2_ARUDO
MIQIGIQYNSRKSKVVKFIEHWIIHRFCTSCNTSVSVDTSTCT